MIIKNGEILAIDHIAHDNTLSGNGTSAKPVGLSETYKSSVANQIKNVNDRLTSVNSALNTRIDNTNSDIANLKSSAHGEIARVDRRIDDVSAAKVDNTIFTEYQTNVANSFTAVNKKIGDVSAAKVDNATFTQYQTEVASEITRVDEKIDTTSANLRDNYYEKNQTYSQSEVDEIVSKLGAYVYVENVTPEGYPIVDEPSSKVIYLTQIPNKSQCLQWIWLETQEWKCIGDTTVDLSDYAKTVDVVASANNNVQAVKDWADDKFETKENFESVITGYYTKDDADGLLNTKVDKTTFEAYQQTVSDAFDSVDRDFDNTSAWANDTFATKTDLTDVQSDLEREISNLSTDIESDLANVSGKIINELNDVESALDNKINNVDTKLDTVSGELIGKIDETNAKIDTVSGELVGKIKTVEETLSADIDEVDENVEDLRTELETEYYDADTIDDILAASGNYYTQSQVDEKLEEYVKSTELEPINEKIDSVSAEFNKYYTKTEVDDEFTTKDTFDNTIADINNDLADIVETVSAIDQDKADKSDLNNYYKISETSGKDELSAEFAKYTKTEDLHIPTTVAELTDSGNYYTTAETSGKNQLSAAFDAILKYNVTAAAGIEVTTATDAGVKTFGISMTAEPVVTDTTLSGYNGIAATRDATISNQWNIGLTQDMLNTIDDKLDSSDAAQTYLTKTDAASTYQEIGNYLENTDIELDANNKITGISGKELVITAHQSLANYYTKSDVDAALTNKVDTSELETVSGEIVNMIPSLNGYATEAWVNGKNYLVADDIAGKADKTDLQYVSAGVDYVSGNIPTKVTDLTDSADYAKKTDLEGFVTRDGITTQGTDYVMTTTGWKVLSLPGGGMTQVIHDATLTGQGNADNDKLGVAWSALSGNTIASALSAGSATVAANLGTSSFADITGAINAKADATAISDMLTKTDAASTYQTKAGMSNYLTTSDASTTYQTIAGMSNYLTTAQYETDSAKYVSTGDILTADSNKLTGIKVGNTDYTIQETNWTTTIQTASAKAYNDATANANELYVTKASAHTEFVNTSSWANNTFQPKGNYVATADLLINASNQLTGIKIDNSTNYPIPLFGGVTTDNSTITGDGNTNPLGIAWSALSGYTITSALSAGSATSAYSAYSASYATTAAAAYIDADTISAMSDIVDELHDKLDSTAAATTYLPLTGGTVSGQLTVSGGNSFDNNLHLKRGNNEGFIGLAGNGAITLKNVISNSTSQIEFLTSANKTFDITVKDNNSTPQPVGKLYVMSAHSLADASATSANWANDGMLHIILES